MLMNPYYMLSALAAWLLRALLISLIPNFLVSFFFVSKHAESKGYSRPACVITGTIFGAWAWLFIACLRDRRAQKELEELRARVAVLEQVAVLSPAPAPAPDPSAYTGLTDNQ